MQTHAALAVGLALALACTPSGPTATIATKQGPVRVTLEVVADDASRARGLMYRDKLPDGHGMLFVFDEEVEHPFWMKNTLIPLDMIFIASDRRIVGILTNTTPLSRTSVSVGRPSKWVLEVAGGYTTRAGIATGDQIDFTLP
jgi:uncharacterized protein